MPKPDLEKDHKKIEKTLRRLQTTSMTETLQRARIKELTHQIDEMTTELWQFRNCWLARFARWLRFPPRKMKK